MNDDDDDIVMTMVPMMTRIPLVMVVDSGAHNFQIFHVKPQLYALFVEKEEKVEANVRSHCELHRHRPWSGVTAVQPHQHHQAVDVLLLPHQDAFGGAENPLKVVSTVHATEVAPCAVHCTKQALQPYTKEDA